MLKSGFREQYQHLPTGTEINHGTLQSRQTAPELDDDYLNQWYFAIFLWRQDTDDISCKDQEGNMKQSKYWAFDLVSKKHKYHPDD